VNIVGVEVFVRWVDEEMGGEEGVYIGEMEAE